MTSVRALIRRLNVAWIAARAVSPNTGSAKPADKKISYRRHRPFRP
jgi:hypothetical protein